MSKVVYCKWMGQVYPDRYCNKQAGWNDDLCHTHRGYVDAQVRIFDRAFQDYVNYGH